MNNKDKNMLIKIKTCHFRDLCIDKYFCMGRENLNFSLLR